MNVLELVVVRDSDVSTVGNEIVHLLFTEGIRLDGEGKLNEVLDGLETKKEKDASGSSPVLLSKRKATHVFDHPLETGVIRGVDDLEILKNGKKGKESGCDSRPR